MNLLLLTCADKEEAEAISKILLEKRLIACSKMVTAESLYKWKGKMENSSEILLVMESKKGLFEKVDEEVSSLHSYDQSVLIALDVTKMGKGVSEWLESEI